MKKKILLLTCVIAMMAICLTSCILNFGHEHTVKHVEAKAATCSEAGNVEYWYCTECDEMWTDEALTKSTDKDSVVTATVAHEYTNTCDAHCKNCNELTNTNANHTIEHVEAVAPTCYTEGNIEYWYCTVCGTAWTDEALTGITNQKSVKLSVEHTELVHFDAVAAGCHYDGNVEYWVCYDCEQVWTNEALTQLSNIKNVVVPATEDGNVKHFEATEANCHQNGNIEYWYCDGCYQFWQDEALTQLTNSKNVIIPCTAEIKHVDAVQASCHQNGNVEYWYCADCNAVFTDAALTQLSNFKSVVVAYTANIVHVDAAEANCHQNGNLEYWYCAECNAVFTDAALTQLSNFKSVTTPCTAEIVHVDAVAANCHQNGNLEYWYCAECNAVFTDATLTQLSNFKSVVVAYTANIVHVEAVEATTEKEGNVEYWYCPECNAVFTDAALTQLSNFKNVIIPIIAE